MAELNMPRLSDTMEEGTIGRWLKKPGDSVEKGDILLEIETDKATMELEAYESGTLQKIVVQEGETVPIGAVIAYIGEGELEEVPAGDAPAAEAAPTAGKEPQATERQSEPEHVVGGNGHSPGERVKASPVARRLAEEYNIDLRQIQGTGPGGRIIKENIEAFRSSGGAGTTPAAEPAPREQPKPAPAPAVAPAPAPSAPPSPAPMPAMAPPPAPASATPQPLSRMRKAIARNMNQAKPGSPHIYVSTEVDMAAALDLRKQINDSGASAVKISVNDLVLKAAAKALVKFPMLNSSFVQGADGQPAILQHPQINVCVAVALEDGLVAPVVVQADKKSLSAISAEVKDMAARAREGKIKQEELDKGTFTLSNLGMYDVVEFGAIITMPQTGILAVGAVREVPVVRNGELAVGQMMFITTSADHRVADGAVAAQFNQEIKRLLETPMSLLV